ncbi:MAG: hypothetical protein AAF197_11455, partial [Pseudomonadota bacterium]
MCTPTRLYKLVIGLIYPAFLGAVIVGLFEKFTTTSWLISEKLLYSISASCILIFYFIADYLVALED